MFHHVEELQINARVSEPGVRFSKLSPNNLEDLTENAKYLIKNYQW
ncbi:MAG: hypothetical protein AAGU19_21460 [Prolixibacteraceae bacterium]